VQRRLAADDIDDDGAWGYDPHDGWIYFGRTLQQALATAKAKRRCNS
jgi:hypothetical protein